MTASPNASANSSARPSNTDIVAGLRSGALALLQGARARAEIELVHLHVVVHALVVGHLVNLGVQAAAHGVDRLHVIRGRPNGAEQAGRAHWEDVALVGVDVIGRADLAAIVLPHDAAELEHAPGLAFGVGGSHIALAQDLRFGPALE